MPFSNAKGRTVGRRFCMIGTAAVLLVVGLAVGLGVGLTRHHSSDSTSAQTQGDTSGSIGTNPTTTGGSPTKAVVKPLPKWSFTNSSQKVYGMSLGNFLSLERWMDEDWWYTLTNGSTHDVWDEWTLCERLGPDACKTALEAHYNTFTADNISTIASYGFNHLRIPISFWAFIPTTADEPYAQGIQLPHLDRIAAAAYSHNMYIVLDLHGSPGSQNGLQQSGRNDSNQINFWTSANQARGDQMVQAAIDYVTNSTYSSIFSAIAICNEPVTYSSGQLDILTGFYERSYTKFAAMKDPVTMIFHDAYQGRDYWKSFINGKNASFLSLEDHPYVGNFPLQYDPSNTLSQICAKSMDYGTYPIPIIITEFSVTTGITGNDAWYSTFYQHQLAAFSASTAGSLFWSWHTLQSAQPVLANNSLAMSYSFIDLANRGDIITRPTKSQSTEQWLETLDSGCSNLPTPTFNVNQAVAATGTGKQANVKRA